MQQGIKTGHAWFHQHSCDTVIALKFAIVRISLYIKKYNCTVYWYKHLKDLHIDNGDGGYGLLAAYIGGPAAQADWLGPKVGGHLAPFLYSSREPSELWQWLCYDDSTRNIVVVIIIIITGAR